MNINYYYFYSLNIAINNFFNCAIISFMNGTVTSKIV